MIRYDHVQAVRIFHTNKNKLQYGEGKN